jgi:ligand-binding sensor domain-containing protein
MTHRVLLLFALLGLLASSCQAQDDGPTRSDDAEASNAGHHAHGQEDLPSVVFKGHHPDTIVYPEGWEDPLFYIEGQLCQHLRSIHEDRDGVLWFATNVYGLMRYDGDTLMYLDMNPGLGKGGVRGGFAAGPEGQLWVGSSSGLMRIDRMPEKPGQKGYAMTLLTEDDGLSGNEIWSLLVDRQGILWVGSTEGLQTYSEGAFSDFPFPKGRVSDTTTYFGYERITGLLEDRDSRLWIGTDGFGITRWDGTQFETWTKADGLADNVISGFLEDRQGHVWISSTYTGISRWDGEQFRHFTQEGLVDGVEAGAWFEDRNGDIWFAVENEGVYRYDGQAFEKFAYGENGLNTNGVLCIYRDRQNRFWFGAWGGLFRFDGQQFTAVTREGPWTP